MGWLKRNLFFAIGVVVAIGLLGGAGFYDYASWGHNQEAYAHLTEVYTKLKDLSNKKPSPGGGQVDNIAAANEQRTKLEAWIGQTRNYFQPIEPIPKPANGPVTDQLFASTLHRTLAQLQHEAGAANVVLPPDYAFSFSAYVAGATATGDRLAFAPGSLGPLSVQLGEVKAISEVLFGAGINTLDGIQRFRVSPDDAGGPLTDYLDDQPMTNDLGILAPYQATFRAFSPEIARALEGFASSPHGFIVNTISVQPAGAAGTTATDAGVYGGGYPPGTPMPGGGRNPYVMGGAPLTAAPVTGKGGLQTVLDEQLLSVTLKVEVVKLTPRN
ncbi:MAG TPA: Amuc_1100 family pilus-like protein [Verrucomicrobiae bacterium]